MNTIEKDLEKQLNNSQKHKKSNTKYIEMEDSPEMNNPSEEYKQDQITEKTDVSPIQQINDQRSSKSTANLELPEQKSEAKEEEENQNNKQANDKKTNEKYRMENFLVGGGHTFLFQRNQVNEQQQDNQSQDDSNNQRGESIDETETKQQNEKLLQEHEDFTSQIISGNLRLVYFSKKIPRYIPWLILTLSVFLGASIPTSILLINASRYVKAFWRFFMTVFWIIPFCVHEYFDPACKNYYKYHLKQAYITSLGSSIWFSFILFSFDYTSVSHSILLGSLSNYFLCAIRSFRKGSKKIELEIVGFVLVTIGVLLVFLDSITMDELQSDKRYQGFDMTEFLNRPWYVRILVGDLLCLLTSYIVCRFGMLKNETKIIYPTYLNLLIMAIFTSINLFLVSIATGCSFSTDKDGVFALFTTKYFLIYLGLSLFSGLGLILSYIYIAKFFEPIVSASTYLFEPIISTILIYIFNIEFLPGPFACLGYVFVLPGQFLILLTRHIIQVRMNKTKETSTAVTKTG